MKYTVKIVPKDNPNAEGEWVDVEHEPFKAKSWLDAATMLEPLVPGFFIVAIRT